MKTTNMHHAINLGMICNIGKSVAVDFTPLQRVLQSKKPKLQIKTSEAAKDARKHVRLTVSLLRKEIVDEKY